MKFNLDEMSEKDLMERGVIPLSVVSPDMRKNSCSTEGTQVLLHDGLTKPIEDIKVFTPNQKGDILVSIEGTYVYPVAMIAGPEKDFPVISIEAKTDKKKYNLKVSKWHSLLRNFYSMVQAYLFREGDRIVTDTGEGIVTSIKYEQYQGDVWNVFLASEEFKNNLSKMSLEMIYAFRKNSLLGLRPKEHIILTNGLAAGSYVMQMQLMEFFRDGVNINQFA